MYIYTCLFTLRAHQTVRLFIRWLTQLCTLVKRLTQTQTGNCIYIEVTYIQNQQQWATTIVYRVMLISLFSFSSLSIFA